MFVLKCFWNKGTNKDLFQEIGKGTFLGRYSKGLLIAYNYVC